MIKEKYVLIKGHPRNIKYYSDLGYDIQVRQEIEVLTTDLMSGSSTKITSICSKCGTESSNTFKDYWIYTNGLVNKFYCIKCKGIKTEKTCLDKYGVSNPMKNDNVKNKIKQNNLDKYGVEHTLQLDFVKDKIKKTNIERYGFENPFSNDDIKEKIKKTNIENLGCEYSSQSKDVQDKIKESNLNKFGFTSYSKTDDYRKKVKETSLIKYGVDHYSKTGEYKNLTKETCLYKYGVDHYSKTEESKKNTKIFRERNTWRKFYNLLSDEYNIISYKDEFFNINHLKCGTDFEISKSLLTARYKLKNILCTKCNPIGVHFSSIEKEVTNFLDEYGIEYVHSDRDILNGKELDIYIPKYNLALEINGLFWHSELYKGQKYHLIKTLLCRERNIHLIHIWEDDWKLKSDILKSIILNKIGLLDNKIWARKCVISEVNSSDARKFLDDNHIQGFSSSSIKLGLYYNNELVSLMTFGWRMTNGKREYELIRFCNKKGYVINGASSKLFKHFINNYQIDEIISYSDVSMFDGNMYDMLGFEKVSISKPNYFWVVNSVRRHRYNFSKKKLVNMGYDPNKTEVEIMTELGYYRIFSCGQEKWVWKSPNNIQLKTPLY